jgi:hypothetical protein
LCFSCTKTKEERIQALVDQSVKNTLLFPESYDPIEIRIDSVFDNMLSDKNIKTACEIIKIGKEIDAINSEIEETNTFISIFSDSGNSRFYRDLKKDLKNLKSDCIEKEKKFMQLLNSLQEQYWQRKAFTGYSAIQKFRAKNNDNDVVMSSYILSIDAETTQCLACYDISNDDVATYLGIIELIQRIGSENYKQEAWKYFFHTAKQNQVINHSLYTTTSV